MGSNGVACTLLVYFGSEVGQVWLERALHLKPASLATSPIALLVMPPVCLASGCVPVRTQVGWPLLVPVKTNPLFRVMVVETWTHLLGEFQLDLFYQLDPFYQFSSYHSSGYH